MGRPFQSDLTEEQILERLLAVYLEGADEEQKAIKTGITRHVWTVADLTAALV